MKEEKKKRSIFKIIVITLVIILAILLIMIGVGYWYLNNKIGKINLEEIDKTEVGISQDTEERLSGYRNIALFGIDSRKDDYGLGNRSDCIIIASINQDTKDIKLMSVYRDTYMQIEENGKNVLDKVTHAYSYGGAQNALKALNTNLDLNITEYITVNFDAVIAAINAIGGVNLNIDNSELKYINNYIKDLERTSGVSSSEVTNTGLQKLDGVQALAYSRIRYTEGGDYKRAERMRTVIEEMVNKAKTLNVAQLNNLVDIILPRVSTNIKSTDMLKLIPTIASFNITESMGWPYNTKGITLNRWYGVPVTLESNVLQLHQEFFGQSDYQVNDTVKNISTQIETKTGYRK